MLNFQPRIDPEMGYWYPVLWAYLSVLQFPLRMNRPRRLGISESGLRQIGKSAQNSWMHTIHFPIESLTRKHRV